MSETQVCEVCGRVPGRQPGGCQRDCASDTVNGYTGEVECLETALDAARAALSAAEKQVEQLVGDVRAISEDYTEAKARAEAAEKREARLRAALSNLYEFDSDVIGYLDPTPEYAEALREAHAVLKEASAASEAQPPPEAIFAPGAQEGEK